MKNIPAKGCFDLLTIASHREFFQAVLDLNKDPWEWWLCSPCNQQSKHSIWDSRGLKQNEGGAQITTLSRDKQNPSSPALIMVYVHLNTDDPALRSLFHQIWWLGRQIPLDHNYSFNSGMRNLFCWTLQLSRTNRWWVFVDSNRLCCKSFEIQNWLSKHLNSVHIFIFFQFVTQKEWISQNFPKDRRYESVIVSAKNGNVLNNATIRYVSECTELLYLPCATCNISYLKNLHR